MKIKNLISSTLIEFQNELLESLESDFKPTLAIVFSDCEKDNTKIARLLEDHDIKYIACSTSGEIVSGVTYTQSISATLFEMDSSYFEIVKLKVKQGDSYTQGMRLAAAATAKFESPSFISLFTMSLQGEQMIAGLTDSLGRDPLIYGGMAADEKTANPYVFTSEGRDHEGLHTIIFDNNKIELNGFAISGWESIGSEHTITKSKDNIIYEINDEPALDYFKKFFGFYTDPLSEFEEDVSTVNAQYPLQVIRNEQTVMRAPLGSDESAGTLTLGGPVNQGEKFKFSIAPGFEVIDQTVNNFNKYKDEIDPPDAMILFSCKARHWAFGPMIENEVEALGQLWDIPYQGFFCFGEIGKNANRDTQYFNETCCLVTLKEK